MTKEQLLFYACLQERLQHYQWDELETYDREYIKDALQRRTHSTVTVVA